MASRQKHGRTTGAAPGAAQPRTRRFRNQRSTGLGRLRRACQRQWLVVVSATLLVATFGILYQIANDRLCPPSVVFWAVTGLWVGVSVAAFRELGRRMVTSLSSLGKHRDYAVLGAAPDLSESALRELPPDHRTPLGCLAFQPASPFATAFRNLQGRLVGSQVVAFIASAPNEGASTVALCTAVAAVQQGQRVILLDCDARRRSFTIALEHEPTAGLTEACMRPDTWRNYLDEEEETGLHFIPATRQANPKDSPRTAGFPALIEHLRGAYDLIVLDCPPALGDAGGAVIARMADQCVVVAAWDETPISALRDTILSLRSTARAAPSVYVNRVPSGHRFGRLRPQ